MVVGVSSVDSLRKMIVDGIKYERENVRLVGLFRVNNVDVDNGTVWELKCWCIFFHFRAFLMCLKIKLLQVQNSIMEILIYSFFEFHYKILGLLFSRRVCKYKFHLQIYTIILCLTTFRLWKFYI